MKILKSARLVWRYTRVFILALLTPLFEKNPSKMKTLSRCQVPMVLSMARVIVLLFAGVMLRQIYRQGIAGWPEATLCMAVVMAIPLLSALQKVKAEETVGFVKTVVDRFGVGAPATEPSKFDDHRNDDARPLKIAA